MVHYSVYAVNRQAAQGFALLFVRFVHSCVYAQDALFNGSRARGAAGGRMPGADGDAMPGPDDLTADRAAGEAGEGIPLAPPFLPPSLSPLILPPITPPYNPPSFPRRRLFILLRR